MCTFLRREVLEKRANASPDAFDGAFVSLAEQDFEFCEDLLDRIEVGASGRNSRGRVARYNAMMPRIIGHEAGPQTGSFEVRFADGRESKYFYFDDIPARRLRPDILTSEQALEQAKALATAKRDATD